MLALVAHWLAALGATVYGGAVVCFALLLPLQPRLTGQSAAGVAATFSSAGPILGLAMGAWVFGGIVERFARTGTFAFAWDTPEAQWDLTLWIVFGALWFSSFVLEIWTMHDMRDGLDDTGAIADAAEFGASYRATCRHLAVNAGLVLVWHSLAALSGG